MHRAFFSAVFRVVYKRKVMHIKGGEVLITGSRLESMEKVCNTFLLLLLPVK